MISFGYFILLLLEILSTCPKLGVSTFYDVGRILKTIYDENSFVLKDNYIGPNFQIINNGTNVNFQCHDMFANQNCHANSDINQCPNINEQHRIWKDKGLGSIVWPPPVEIPELLRSSYTLDDRITVINTYYQQKQNGGEGYTWPREPLDDLSKKPSRCGTYDRSHCDEVFAKYTSQYIANKTGAVMGTQYPWAEAALLGLGANHVMTIEYMAITTDHPRLTGHHPDSIADSYLAGSFTPLDFVFSYSSIEHDGLGRYGDPLNPFSDLESVARVHCMLKPGGLFFLGFPVGPDIITWNAHRIYGKIRLALILLNWELLDVVFDEEKDLAIHLDDSTTNKDDSVVGKWSNQPIFVLRKKEMID